MANSGVAADKIQWYLIADRGDRVECVYPGMPLGETASGELSFSPYSAQLELDVDADGGLVIRPVGDCEVTSRSGTDEPARLESCHGRIEISLSQNVVQIDTDLVYPAPAVRSIRVSSARQGKLPAAEANTEVAVSGQGSATSAPVKPPRNANRDNDDPFAALLSGKRPKPPAKATEAGQPALTSESAAAQILITEPEKTAPAAGKREPESAEDNHGRTAVGGSPAAASHEHEEPPADRVVQPQPVVEVRQVFTVLPESEPPEEQISAVSGPETASATERTQPKPSDTSAQTARQPEEPKVSVPPDAHDSESADGSEAAGHSDEAGDSKAQAKHDPISAEAKAATVPSRSEAENTAAADRQQANANPAADGKTAKSPETDKSEPVAVNPDLERPAAELEIPLPSVEAPVTATTRPAGDGNGPSARSKTPAMIALTAIGAAFLYFISNDAPILEQPDGLQDTAVAPVVETVAAEADNQIDTLTPPQQEPESDLMADVGVEPESSSEVPSSEVERRESVGSEQSNTAPTQSTAGASSAEEPQQIDLPRSETIATTEPQAARAADTSVQLAGSADNNESESALADAGDDAAARLIAAGQVTGSAEAPASSIESESIPATADLPVAVSLPSTPSAGRSDQAIAESTEPPPSAEEIEQARRRALVAADRALAQGRLVQPAEASAYTLYNRVLSLDPDSTEAKNGIRSVRQGLINRALAHLASGALTEALVSLQSAEDIGANPLLIDDLRNEVGVREQQLQAVQQNPQGDGQ